MGPTDSDEFDNPKRTPIFPALPDRAYESVLDFGCGCGRLARQLIQQRPRPRRYLGIDLHRALTDWCEENLQPHAPGFEFRHHDVFYPVWNPGPDKPATAPFPTEDGSRSLVIAYSVFTHLTEAHAEFYLGEAARVLEPDGFLEATWFIFDKGLFPMMQEFQNALYINDQDPTNAVIFDRDWVIETARGKGLAVVGARPPSTRGYHWRITMTPAREEIVEVGFPRDEAPVGVEGTRSATSVHRI